MFHDIGDVPKHRPPGIGETLSDPGAFPSRLVSRNALAISALVQMKTYLSMRASIITASLSSASASALISTQRTYSEVESLSFAPVALDEKWPYDLPHPNVLLPFGEIRFGVVLLLRCFEGGKRSQSILFIG